MNDSFFYSSLFVLCVLVSSFSQLLLKMSAKKTYKSKLHEYLNPLVISAYAIFFGVTLLSVICYNYINLSTGVVLESTGYIFVGVFSFFILKEKYSKRKFIGTLLIILGLVIYSF